MTEPSGPRAGSQDHEPATAATPPPSRWLKRGCIFSVALNLLVAGSIAGFIVRHYGGGYAKGGNSLLSFQRSLPHGRREQLKPFIIQARNKLEPLRQTAQQARGNAYNTLLKVPFDAAAYESALTARLAAQIELRRAANGIFAKLSREMSAKERRDFVAWQRQRRARHRRKYDAGSWYNQGHHGPAD